MRVEALLFSYDTYPGDRGYEALTEVKNALNELEDIIGNPKRLNIILRPDGVKGLILVDLRPTIKNLSEEELTIFHERLSTRLSDLMDKGVMLNVSKIRMIHKLVRTELESIVKAARYFVRYIDSSWRITIRTRKILSREKVIQEVAKLINSPVSLKDYIYNLYIEIIGPTYTVLYLTKRGYEDQVIIRF